MHRTMLMLARIMLKFDARIDKNLIQNKSQIDKIGTKERLEQRPCGLFVLAFAVFGIIILGWFREWFLTLVDPPDAYRKSVSKENRGWTVRSIIWPEELVRSSLTFRSQPGFSKHVKENVKLFRSQPGFSKHVKENVVKLDAWMEPWRNHHLYKSRSKINPRIHLKWFQTST